MVAAKKYLDGLKNKNIHIVGVSGAEGSAVLEFLAKNGAKNIIGHDFSADIGELKKNFSKTHLWLKGKERGKAFEKFIKLPAELRLKDKYLEGILKADIIFAPSSWHLYKSNFPALKKAKNKGIESSGLTKLYFQLAKGKIISVTGTKGKGTTARMIYEILSKAAAGREVFLAGNDRRSGQELEKISKMKKGDILILETSNRQLMNDLGTSPDIGVITNISPDHIDEHGSFEKYVEAKKSLFKYFKKSGIAVLNYDNEITKKIGEELAGGGIATFYFSRKDKIKSGTFVDNEKIYIKNELVSSTSKSKNKEFICDLADVKLIGEHNIENVLAAVLAAYLAGARTEEIRKAIKGFRGLPHRLEFIGQYGGVKFYDDLASTNPESTVAAIKAIHDLPASPKLQRGERFTIYDSRIILVAGGDDKGMEYSGLAKEILKKVGTLILLPGTGSDKLKSQITNSKQFKCEIAECENFNKVLKIIKAQTKTGDIVLVSPASAHFQARYIDILKKPLRNLIVEKFR